MSTTPPPLLPESLEKPIGINKSSFIRGTHEVQIHFCLTEAFGKTVLVKVVTSKSIAMKQSFDFSQTLCSLPFILRPLLSFVSPTYSYFFYDPYSTTFMDSIDISKNQIRELLEAVNCLHKRLGGGHGNLNDPNNIVVWGGRIKLTRIVAPIGPKIEIDKDFQDLGRMLYDKFIHNESSYHPGLTSIVSLLLNEISGLKGEWM
ncbi:unnamed protein product [Cuscuta epithymum]|uniref:Protein kinase domain-containing protein n=1 Tax=Cuscuta epithymum TaxID=186058 RepID=A0AAV0EBE8_9ASTE|nr:unnamed protein product [Cuscuta epithymum]CAH9148875.1 unnamed protein product [Cuscuta epithymum]